MAKDFRELNAELNLIGDDPNEPIQFNKDKEAARDFFVNEKIGVNANTVFFHTLEEKTTYLIENKYWDPKVVLRYGQEELKNLFQYAHSFKHRFQTFLGAYKFYASYALKTNSGDRWLERFEDRVVLTAIAYSSDASHARRLISHIIEGRFQPATPTFLNSGKVAGGGPTSCFLLRVDDNMESISRAQTDALQLSKRGGGVAFSLSNIREYGAPIKNVENQATGVVPIMKILEDSFSYANQLGARQGAGAVYLNVHHPDLLKFLDTKRENADEKIRIKSLSIGLVMTDIVFEKAQKNEDFYLFSPYDVKKYYDKDFTDISLSEWYDTFANDDRIKKTRTSARKLFTRIAEIQFESGYPYLMFEDTVNKYNVAPNVGRISQSNLCSEILQPQQPSEFNVSSEFEVPGRDIACNLGSLNVAKMESVDVMTFVSTVSDAVEFLSNVSESGDFSSSPSVESGNKAAHAIGLGQMNLHGYLIERGVDYDSEEAIDLWRDYIQRVTFYAIHASSRLAISRGVFSGYEGSDWENGSVIERMIEDTNSHKPGYITERDWRELQKGIARHGIHNQNIQAIPPTGSISYINNSTSSIHPIASKIEIRKEGKLGRVYYPAYGLDNSNFEAVKSAYEIGPNPIIDMYAASTPYVDQGQSLTLFFKDTSTTRDLNRAHKHAHKQGIKTLYYIRIQQKALEGTEVEGCVSCTL